MGVLVPTEMTIMHNHRDKHSSCSVQLFSDERRRRSADLRAFVWRFTSLAPHIRGNGFMAVRFVSRGSLLSTLVCVARTTRVPFNFIEDTLSWAVQYFIYDTGAKYNTEHDRLTLLL